MIGTIFDIKRFAIHDGGGIRSTLFIKGCPLRCPWCQNPEGRAIHLSLHHFPSRCIGCGTCTNVCPKDALSLRMEERIVEIDSKKCDLCRRCIENCPAKALAVDGWKISAEDAVKELSRDGAFFSESGGGVTLSGGEPFFQHEFSRSVLEGCKRKGINTAIETCLVCSQDILDIFIDITDQFIVDIKIFNAEKHKEIIGSENKIIFKNIKYLVSLDADVLIRTPLIPGFTAFKENLREIGEWIAKLPIQPPMELINYNPLAENKFRRIHIPFPINELSEPYSALEMKKFKDVLKSAGINKII